MATENPMRIVDRGGAGNWAPPRGTADFASSTTRVVADELELLLRGHNVDRDQSNVAPNRSGSAPPSMESTFATSGNLVNHHRLSDSSLAAVGNNWRSHSVENRGIGSMYISTSSLSAHAEEPEDDRTPMGASDDREGSSDAGQNTLSFSSRHKSLVDFIQEGFPRTPSPVFSRNRSSIHVGEPFIHDMQSLSLDSGTGSASNVHISPGSTATNNPSAASIPINPQKDELTSKDASFASACVSGGTTGSDSSRSLYIVEDVRYKRELGFDKQNETHPQSTYSHPAAGSHGPRSQTQGTFQQANNNYGHFDINSVEMQPLPHAPGGPPPLYASTPAYMPPGNSLYANYNASSLYTPQYGGYPMDSSFLPPYLAGYPPQTGFVHFNANSGQSFSSQSPSIPTGESFSKGSAMQNLNRFHGQYGVTMPPTFPDPLSLQYFQQTMHDQYGVPVHDHLTSAGDQKFQFPPSGSVDITSAGRIRVPGIGYLSSPTGLGFVPQFPSSPLGSPVLPDSPVGSASSLGRRYDIGFSQSTARNVGGYARWQGQRGLDSVNDYRKHSFLEELKASSARRIDLSDVVGRIVEFSIDQHGSRFIQQKLENCSVQEKESVFKEVLPHASKLITDVFGNYVIQKFFEYGTFEQRKQLAYQLSGQMLPLSLQMYGCRVIQKALEVIEVDQKTELVHELDGHVMRCVRDQNGNHVIQKCIECLPAEKIDFIISAFEGQVATLSTHPYGCRVIQRVLEHCSGDVRCRSIVDEILESVHDLARDQYGNYVTQHVLERGKPFERSQIIRKLSGKVVQMSQHKYASNVVEKCLEFGDAAERDFLIEEILLQSEDNDNLLVMMKDQFANYVVQKILEISNDKHREMLLHRIRLHLIALKKYTYGKHIAARFEQLCDEDNETSDP